MKSQRRNRAARRTERERIDIDLGWNQREEFESLARIIAHGGGYGSGKSYNNAALLAKWDDEGATDQRYGLFANTANQAKNGALAEIRDLFDTWGVKHEYGRRPPQSWFDHWRREGIRVPAVGASYANTLTIHRHGLHCIVGGLEGNSFRRYKAFTFRNIIIEEVAEQRTQTAIEWLFARCRCGQAHGRKSCGHLHQAFLRWNPPPPGRPHWLREWVKQNLIAEAIREANGQPPFFHYIQSSTQDNVENVGEDYVAQLEAGLSETDAIALIDGDLDQKLSGRTFYEFDRDESVIPLEYHPTRELYVSLDFNVSPAVAALGHRLDAGEVPEQHRRLPDFEYFGVFGEFFRIPIYSAEQLARALLVGDRKAGGRWPLNFEGLAKHANRIYMHGDASGGARRAESPTAESAWAAVNKLLFEELGDRKYIPSYPKSNPSKWDSVSTMNAMFCARNGQRRLFVSPLCEQLIFSLENVVPKSDGSDPIDKPPGDLITHSVDTVRYPVAALFTQSFKHNYGSVADLAEAYGGGTNEFDYKWR